MINYSLSRYISDMISARESECYSNAYYGALFLMGNGYSGVYYMVGDYITPHNPDVPLYHCWITCNDNQGHHQIIDPTAVIVYNRDDAELVEYYPKKRYHSDYIMEYNKALNGAPFIDIERTITKGEFDDFDKAELKATLREITDAAKNERNSHQHQRQQQQEYKTMKYHKSYAKTIAENVLLNPDLRQWLCDSRDTLQQISEWGGSRDGILPVILAMWGACDGFNERYPASEDSGVWLGELSESLAALVKLCSMNDVDDAELFAQCENIAYDFQESIDSIEINLDEIAETPIAMFLTPTGVSTGSSPTKSQPVKFGIADIAHVLTDLLPGGYDRRQKREFDKLADTELSALFDEFLKMIKWWDNIASVYGEMAGELDNFTQDFRNVIAKVAPTLYAEWWDIEGGFKDWFMNNVYPILSAIRPPRFRDAEKPFNEVMYAFQNLAKEMADLAKINLEDAIPDSLPEQWPKVASVNGQRKSIKSDNPFLDWLQEVRGLISTVKNSSVTFINQSAIELNKYDRSAEKWDEDERIHNAYSFDYIVKDLKKATDIAFDIDTNSDITNGSIKFRRLCSELIDELDKIIDQEKEAVITKSYKSDDDFLTWVSSVAGIIGQYRDEFPRYIREKVSTSLPLLARRANEWADDERIQDMYSFSDYADDMIRLAKRAPNVTDQNRSGFAIDSNDLSEALFSIADQERDYQSEQGKE